MSDNVYLLHEPTPSRLEEVAVSTTIEAKIESSTMKKQRNIFQMKE